MDYLIIMYNFQCCNIYIGLLICVSKDVYIDIIITSLLYYTMPWMLTLILLSIIYKKTSVLYIMNHFSMIRLESK